MKFRRGKVLLARWTKKYYYSYTDTRYAEYNRVISGFPCTPIATLSSSTTIADGKPVMLNAYIKVYNRHIKRPMKDIIPNPFPLEEIPNVSIGGMTTTWYGCLILLQFNLSPDIKDMNDEYAKNAVDELLRQLGYNPKISRECMLCKNPDAWDTVLREIIINNTEVTLTCCDRCEKYKDKTIIQKLTKSGLIKYL